MVITNRGVYMKRRVLIVGAGPRGIAVAIEAKYRGYECVLIDKDAMALWDDAVPNMLMRSPLTFDLVYPGAPTWGTSSLMKYVHPGSPEPVWKENLQKDLEYMPERCTRDVFIAYTKQCLQELDAPIIRDRVSKVSKTGVHTVGGEYIEGDIVVVAAGLSPITEIPAWVAPVSHKLITAREVIDGLPISTYAVVGNGQSGAEYCELLARQGSRVYWLLNGAPRVTQYPAPTYIDWGMRSALSNYYRTIPTEQMRQEYLMQIKAWQPSITPHISTLIRQRGDAITVLDGPGTREGYASWEALQRKVTGVLLCTGNKPTSVSYVEVPDRLPGGKLSLDRFMASNGVYHTGLLAIGYDGPRQASFISAGITAKEIINADMDSQS